MTTRFTSITAAALALAALGACSNTASRAAGSSPAADVPAITSTLPGAATVAPPLAVTPTAPASTTSPASVPPTTAPPPATAPTTPPTAPPTTAPPTTVPPTTAPPTTVAPPPLYLVRGPMVVRLTDACYEAVWPIKVWGTVEHRFPLDPARAPESHDFEVLLQPQQYLDVIDDIREVHGRQGDIQTVVTMHVAHFTDPDTYEVPISSMGGTIHNGWPLGAVDVLAPATTCYLTLTWDQTVTTAI